MLKEKVLTSVDPKRFAKSKETLQGSLPASSFNLPAEVLPGSEDVRYQLRFGFDSENYVYIHGSVEAVLHLQCQRCLQPMEHKIYSEFSLSPVQDANDAATLPECYEAVLMDQDRVSALRIVEDELILSLPIAPMHENEDCLKDSHQ